MSADVGKIETPTAAGDVLDGLQTFGVSTGATTVIQVPAGRTWVGVIAVNVSCQNAGANAATAQATGIVSTAGAGVTPAAGNYVRCTAFAGANVAAGTVGDSDANSVVVPMVVIAPGANAVQVQAAASISGSGGEVNVSAIGVLQ